MVAWRSSALSVKDPRSWTEQRMVRVGGSERKQGGSGCGLIAGSGMGQTSRVHREGGRAGCRSWPERKAMGTGPFGARVTLTPLDVTRRSQRLTERAGCLALNSGAAADG